MLKVLKMDFYRVKRNKLNYILMAAAVLFSIIMMFSYVFLEMSIKLLDVETLGEETVALINSTVPHNFEGYFTMFLSSNLIIVFIVIFAVLLCSAEYNTGYIKNTAVNILPRHLSFFSKLIIVAIYTVIIFLLVFLVVLGGCAILGHVDFSKLSDPDIMKRVFKMIAVLLVQIVCNISLTAFFMMIYYVTRTTIIPMVSGLVYSTMGSLIYSLINMLLSVGFPNKNLDSSVCTNLGNIVFHVNIEGKTKDFIIAIVVAVIFLVISSYFSCLAINKKDVK